MKWAIEKVSNGYMVVCFTENTGSAFMGRDIHLQARFDTFREAVEYARSHGVNI